MEKLSNDAALRAQKNMPEQLLLNLPLAKEDTGTEAPDWKRMTHGICKS